jgi:hypothetical protein
MHDSEPEAGITADHVLLGDLGMDLGLLDDVRGHQSSRTGRRGPRVLLPDAGRHRTRENRATCIDGRRVIFDIEAALTRPEEQQGPLCS